MNSALISIIDDDRSVREAIQGLIRSLGYATAAFESAEEYLDSGRIDDTACIITDLQMPGLSGIDLQRRLLADGHDTPIIFVTAFPSDRLRRHALDAGAFGFLSKPFNEASLIACIDKALQRPMPN
ncbi:MAG TPA: response regulator [Xanthobacteraceae bacterium]|nr:response regulator [Xanthobacteraceae bacterium]